MNIIIQFKGLGYQDIFQADIYLCDSNQCCYQGVTYDGKIHLCLKPCQVYKMIAISKGEVLKKVFFVDAYRKIYTFVFHRSIVMPNHLVTFLLTDSYYKNLPIEKGELFLD